MSAAEDQPPFRISRRRDASAALSGFVYQIQLSVLRWIELGDDEHLELECGEDIDRIGRSLTSGDGRSLDRVLEQVKKRKQRLSLRSPDALSALANAAEHLHTNPQLKLLFRFSTTATLAKERGVSFPNGMTGVDTWEAIRAGALSGSQALAATSAIRKLLTEARRPKDAPEATWALLGDVLGEESRLLSFIKTFEWSSGLPTSAQVEARTRDLLVAGGYCGEAEAEALRQRLFVHVIEVITAQESRRLAREDLTTVSGQTDLTDIGAALLATLGKRIGSVESNIDDLTDRQGAVEREVRKLTTEVGAVKSVTLAIPGPSTAVPPSSERSVAREPEVESVVSALRSVTWLAIYGEAGSGKTELAKLIAGSWGGTKVWIPVGGEPSHISALIIDAACGGATGDPLEERLTHLGCRVGKGGLLVVDDLPRLKAQDSLAQRLVVLAQICRSAGASLLTTSIVGPPSLTIEALGDVLSPLPVPEWSEDNCRDLLVAYGAPPDYPSAKFISFFHALTKGSVSLAVAGARWMAERGWRFSWDDLDGLLRGIHLKELTHESRMRLGDLVGSEAARQLLYRLNLVEGEFGLPIIRALAEEAPPVLHPLERLSDLRDVCVRPEGVERYSVAPVFKVLGSGDVPEETRRACCRVLARSLMREPRIGPQEAVRAIGYFQQAAEWEGVGFVLLLALTSLSSEDDLVDDWMFSSMWGEGRLPVGLRVGIRLAIRAYQCSIRRKLGRAPLDCSAEILDLLGEAVAVDTPGIAAVMVMLAPALAERDVMSALAIWKRANDRLAEVGPGPLELTAEMNPAIGLWLLAIRLSSLGEINEWVDVVDSLHDHDRAAMHGHAVAPAAINQMMNAAWLENREGATEASWTAWLEDLDALIKRFEDAEAAGLYAGAVRVRIIVLAEELKTLEPAIEAGQAALAREFLTPQAQFVLNYVVGSQYVYKQDHENARPWLTRALERADDALAMEHVYVLLYLAAGCADDQQEERIALAERAVAIAQSAPEITQLQRAKAWAELGIATWMGDGLAPAVMPLLHAYDELWAARDDSEVWRATFNLFGHSLGYLYGVAALGRPPEHLANGEDFTAPFPGIVAITNLQIAALYSDEKAIGLSVQMAGLLAHANAWDDWDRVVSDAYARAAGPKVSSIRIVLGPDEVVRRVIRHDLTGALAVAVETSEALIGQAREHLERTAGIPEAVLRTSQGIAALQPDESSLMWWLVPTTVRIVQAILDDEETARHLIDGARAACNERARESAAGDTWKRVSRLLEDLFAPSATFKQSLELGNEAKKQERAWEHLAAYLGAAACDDATLEGALSVHATCLHGLHSRNLTRDVLGPLLIAPYLEAYWARALQEQRFQFRTPQVVASAFAEAREAPLRLRAKAVLQAVDGGLITRLPGGVREWLSQA